MKPKQTDSTKIKFAGPKDVAEMSVLSRDEVEYGLGWNYTSKKILELIENNNKNVVVARNAEKLLGFGIMTYGNDQANLDLLAVNVNYRRMRVGSQIVNWLEEVAMTAGSYNVFVQVRENNTGAISFYEKLGFQKLERIQGFYRGVEDAVLMVKLLRPMLTRLLHQWLR